MQWNDVDDLEKWAIFFILEIPMMVQIFRTLYHTAYNELSGLFKKFQIQDHSRNFSAV